MKQGWEKKKLPDVLWFQEGPGVRKHQYVSEGIKLLNVANLVNGKLDLSTSDRYISIDEAYGKYKHFLVDEGDLILASSGIQVEYIEKKMGFVQKEHLPLCMNTSTIRFKTLNKNVLDIEYFMYFLKSYEFKRQLFSLITGCAQLNYGPSHLKQMVVPVPPIAEQEKIVAELDCLSGIIEKKKQQLKELDNLAQSIFYEMFGDPVENDKGWKTSPLHKVSTLINGRAYKQNELLDSGKYRVLRVGNFFTNGNYYYSDLELEDDKYCDNGDLLFAWSASFGAFIWNEDKVIYHYHIWKVLYDNDLLDIQYYRYLLNTMTAFFMKDVHGIGMVHLTKAGMEQYVLPLPPLALQQDFASKIESIEKQKELITQSIKETETLFNSRMDYYFN